MPPMARTRPNAKSPYILATKSCAPTNQRFDRGFALLTKLSKNPLKRCDFNKEVDRVRCFTAIVAANLIATWFTASSGRASQISLPNFGTNIIYDYAVGTPKFVVAKDGASESIIHSEVSFADNKHLFVEFDSNNRLVQIDLELRGHNLFELFEPASMS